MFRFHNFVDQYHTEWITHQSYQIFDQSYSILKPKQAGLTNDLSSQLSETTLIIGDVFHKQIILR